MKLEMGDELWTARILIKPVKRNQKKKKIMMRRYDVS